MKQPFQKVGSLAIALVLVFLSFSVYLATAAPSGAEILSNTTSTAGITSPANRTDDGGTVTTIVFETLQQVGTWKGYVGNVTGTLSLDDADSFTLYDWSLAGVSVQGEVYSTRNQSVNWPSVTCASSTNIAAEEAFHNMSGSDADSISSTFNFTFHDSIAIGTSGGVNTIPSNSCSSTATYVNDSAQTMTNLSETRFQEVILNDSTGSVIFTTVLEDNFDGYRDDGTTYDFQMIVPESDVKSQATTYFFFLEIG